MMGMQVGPSSDGGVEETLTDLLRAIVDEFSEDGRQLIIPGQQAPQREDRSRVVVAGSVTAGWVLTLIEP